MSREVPYCTILKALRKLHGETQLDAAQRLMVDVRTISSWESPSSKRLSARQMKRVYSLYKVSEARAKQTADEYLADLAARPPEPVSILFKGCDDQVLCFDSEGGVISRLGMAKAIAENRKLLLAEVEGLRILLNCEGEF